MLQKKFLFTVMLAAMVVAIAAVVVYACNKQANTKKEDNVYNKKIHKATSIGICSSSSGPYTSPVFPIGNTNPPLCMYVDACYSPLRPCEIDGNYYICDLINMAVIKRQLCFFVIHCVYAYYQIFLL